MATLNSGVNAQGEMMRRTTLLLLCFVGISGSASKALSAIAITGAYTDAFVYVPATGPVDNSSDNLAGATLSASSAGYSSTTSTVYSTSGDAANFSAVVTHVREGDFSGQAYSQIQVNFTPENGGIYTAAGFYSNSNGYTLLSSYLFDANTASYVFNSSQESFAAPASFTLGGTSGNSNNTFTGSLTGYLVPGHFYTWAATIFTAGYPDPDSGAAPSGEVSLSILPVPEFSSILVCSLLTLTIGGGWRLRAKLEA